MSDTPRTDKHMEGFNAGWDRCPITPEFARELERENNQLREALRGYVNADDWSSALQTKAIEALTNFATVEQPGMNTGPRDGCEVACPTRADAGLNPARGANLT